MNNWIYKTFFFIRRYYHRNSIILSDFHRRTENNMVNLHWWSPPMSINVNGEKTENLGDHLANPIFQYLLERNGIEQNICYGKKHLYTVGSIVFMGLQDSVIWGSGLLTEDNIPFLVSNKKLSKFIIKLDIRAVRGPKTREVLCQYGYNCPKIYGDPAILMPLIYNPSLSKKYEYTVIHHMSSKKINEGISILTTDYKSFINRIIQSELVISGSLHGIILAETYGIPAILLADRENMNMFKYMDYYYGTGREEFQVAKTVDEALKMERIQPPNFTKQQNDLLETFPIDLWK